MVRLIGQHLIDLGFKRTVDLLFQESGLNGLDHPEATRLQQYIIGGEWEKLDSLVVEIANHSTGDKEANVKEMRLIILEQKFLELVEDNRQIEALKCLRHDITPLHNDMKRIQLLASLLLCRSSEEIRLRANWSGKGQESRQKLVDKFQKFIPPLLMLPSKRLATLISQAVELQKDRCILHNSLSDSDYVDLKYDHICKADKFPLHSCQELNNHRTEVWFCKFSNDGLKLATGGLGGRVIIWDLDPISHRLKEKCNLDNNCYSITCLSWSPNDNFLLVTLSEDKNDLMVWNVEKQSIHLNIQQAMSTTTCSWHMSGQRFAAASIKGNFNVYDMSGLSKGQRDGVRVQALSFLHKDPDVILAADSLNRIKAYAIGGMSLETDEEDILEERHSIMSFTIDKDDRYIAVNLVEQGIHLWDYKSKTLLRMFFGVRQRNFTIHSSFSSPDATFLASGSEDGKIYIYHSQRDQPVAILHGHTRCVNCVSWNPKYPELLVSVSDDRLVRLWAPDARRDCFLLP